MEIALHNRLNLGSILFFAVMTMLAFYFLYAIVQGPFGVLTRLQVQAEMQDAQVERERLQVKVDRLRNLTKRLSNDYLDLDLLDERARNVLGFIRADEVLLKEQGSVGRPGPSNGRVAGDPRSAG
ncbi:septum formation initiator family protein [Paracoccus sp. (in: a-proteobacteria)]|uniref:FtsB family cell division protein n=1 Tax=Paracoccus sp. TaxID=267 RepID=UPI003242C0BA